MTNAEVERVHGRESVGVLLDDVHFWSERARETDDDAYQARAIDQIIRTARSLETRRQGERAQP